MPNQSSRGGNNGPGTKKTGHRTGKTWSMYPLLHGEVSRLLGEHNLQYSFHGVEDEDQSIKEYDTNIMGRFMCHNGACNTTGWSSKVVTITIRLYAEKRYNARVYHQRCKACNQVSRPILDESYAERVAYRITKWAGVHMEQPPSRFQQRELPHEESLCEGCKAGHCRQGVGSG